MREFSVSGRAKSQVYQRHAGEKHLEFVEAKSKQGNVFESFKVIKLAEESVSKASVSEKQPSKSGSTVVQTFIAPPLSLRDQVTRAEILFALKLVFFAISQKNYPSC